MLLTSLASRTQPTPARIAFVILKAIRAGVGWVWLARLKHAFDRIVPSAWIAVNLESLLNILVDPSWYMHDHHDT